jgi:hypothetical protein
MKLFSQKNKKDIEKTSSAGLDVLDVDLIKGEDDKELNWKKYFILIFLAIIATVALALEINWLINLWQKQESQKTQDTNINIDQVKVDIAELEIDYQELTEFKNKADLMTDLIDKHPHWTNFFNWLERRTLSSVHWEAFNGDLSGLYILEGETNTFADVSWQVAAFLDDDFVKSVAVDSASGGLVEETVEIEGRFNEEGDPLTETVVKSQVSFSLQLEIEPSIFYLQ